MQNRLLLKN